MASSQQSTGTDQQDSNVTYYRAAGLSFELVWDMKDANGQDETAVAIITKAHAPNDTGSSSSSTEGECAFKKWAPGRANKRGNDQQVSVSCCCLTQSTEPAVPGCKS